MLSKRARQTGYILYDSICMKSSRIDKPLETEHRSEAAGSRGGGDGVGISSIDCSQWIRGVTLE